MGKDDLRVGEMFAGVGGFRLGLEGVPSKDWETEFLKFEKTGFKVVWSNQWEPPPAKTKSKSKKRPKGMKRRCSCLTHRGEQCLKEEYGIPEGGFCKKHAEMYREGAQWASEVYAKRFGNEGHHDCDIHKFTKRVKDTHQIPQLDLLVGGFPCQDYSVARTVSGELGIEGEKGKLWEPIWRIISRSHANRTRHRPKIVLLENVPRLLNSPANARGLNFSVILKRLLGMGYEVEWRVIHADDYSFPQQRDRVFIIAYRTEGRNRAQKITNGSMHFGLQRKDAKGKSMRRWIFGEYSECTEEDGEIGPFAEAFPAKFEVLKERSEIPEIEDLSHRQSPFGSAGYAWSATGIKLQNGKKGSRKVFKSWKAIPIKEKPRTIRNIMVQKGEANYEESYEVNKAELEKWEYEKGAKREYRIRKDDLKIHPKLAPIYEKCKKSKNQKVWDKYQSRFEDILGTDGSYKYEEGKMSLTDSLDKPSRTVVTAEIGKSASRMRHLIKHDDGTYRTLFPIETERLNMFPDNWTKINDEKGKEIPDSKRGFMMGNALVVGIIQRLREPIGELIRRRRSI